MNRNRNDKIDKVNKALNINAFSLNSFLDTIVISVVYVLSK